MKFACRGEGNRAVQTFQKVMRHGRPRFSAQSHRANDGTADDDSGENTHRKNHDCHGDAPCRIGWLVPQDLPGLRRARDNPAGRKPLHEKVSGLRGYPQANRRSPLQPQRPDYRTADDPTGNAASDNDHCHDVSMRKMGRHHGPVRGVRYPHRVKKTKQLEPQLTPAG